jgi:hypothetical protein
MGVTLEAGNDTMLMDMMPCSLVRYFILGYAVA